MAIFQGHDADHRAGAQRAPLLRALGGRMDGRLPSRGWPPAADLPAGPRRSCWTSTGGPPAGWPSGRRPTTCTRTGRACGRGPRRPGAHVGPPGLRPGGARRPPALPRRGARGGAWPGRRYDPRHLHEREGRATATTARRTPGCVRSTDEPHDAATANGAGGAKGAGPRIAPTTVVVMLVPIRVSAIEGARSDGSRRTRSARTRPGCSPTDWSRWVKAQANRPTGRGSSTRRAEIVLPRGQIFIQVVPKTSAARFSVEATR